MIECSFLFIFENCNLKKYYKCLLSNTGIMSTEYNIQCTTVHQYTECTNQNAMYQFIIL